MLIFVASAKLALAIDSANKNSELYLPPIQETIKILTYTVLFYFDKIVS